MNHISEFQSIKQLFDALEKLDTPHIASIGNDMMAYISGDRSVTLSENGKLTVLRDVEDAANGYDYVDLGLPSGRLWAAWNVGAGMVDEGGLYFQWGDTDGYMNNDIKEFNWSTYKYGSDWNKLTKYNVSADSGIVDNLTELTLEDDAARANMGGFWRMPSVEDFNELLKNTTSEWGEYEGAVGRIFTGKNENQLFFPAAGYCNDTLAQNQGSNVYVWPRSLNTANPNLALDFRASSDFAHNDFDARLYGYSVRGVL